MSTKAALSHLMGRHPGYQTEFVIYEHEGQWQTNYHGATLEDAIDLDVDDVDDARIYAADYWGVEPEDIKIDDNFSPEDWAE